MSCRTKSIIWKQEQGFTNFYSAIVEKQLAKNIIYYLCVGYKLLTIILMEIIFIFSKGKMFWKLPVGFSACWFITWIIPAVFWALALWAELWFYIYLHFFLLLLFSCSNPHFSPLGSKLFHIFHLKLRLLKWLPLSFSKSGSISRTKMKTIPAVVSLKKWAV